MNLPELHERIARWEDLHTEFKEWPVQPDDLAASLVAFPNTGGWQLILGVTNNRVLVGVEDADQVTRDVDNVAVNNCESPITVIQEVLYPAILPQGRAVVVVNVPKGDSTPIAQIAVSTTSTRPLAATRPRARSCCGHSKTPKAYATTKRPYHASP